MYVGDFCGIFIEVELDEVCGWIVIVGNGWLEIGVMFFVLVRLVMGFCIFGIGLGGWIVGGVVFILLNWGWVEGEKFGVGVVVFGIVGWFGVGFIVDLGL